MIFFLAAAQPNLDRFKYVALTGKNLFKVNDKNTKLRSSKPTRKTSKQSNLIITSE